MSNQNRQADNQENEVSFSNNVASARSNLKCTIKSSVKATNAALAIMEESYVSTQSNFVSRLGSLQRQGRFVAEKAIRAYQAREQYGPQVVGSSAVVLGGITTLRRGKLPGVAVGMMAGSAAYAAVYGIPIYTKVEKKN